jgi:peptidoglycan/xylan/chitin deacetylase (PgdA/CDA1 family)
LRSIWKASVLLLFLFLVACGEPPYKGVTPESEFNPPSVTPSPILTLTPTSEFKPPTATPFPILTPEDHRSFIPLAVVSEGSERPRGNPSTPTLRGAVRALTASSSPTPTATPTAIRDLLPDGVLREAAVPILMYHHVGEPPPGADAMRRDLTVLPSQFETQLAYLSEEGYQTIHLSDLIMHLQMGLRLPSKPIVITFDDGYHDVFTNAYPLLEEYGLVGTFFIITSLADEGREGYLSWAEIKALHAAGMEIGSHTYTHPDLRGQPYDYVVWQVLGSKEAIEARTKEPVRLFSYPSGRYDQQVVEVLNSTGYWGAVTVDQAALQSSDRTFELQRIRVRGSYNLRDFVHWLNYWLENSE